MKKINRTAFNYELSLLTGADKLTLDSIGGSLRKAGMVSVGGRGPHAPDITPEDARNIILGLLGSDNASKAAEAVKVLLELKSEDGRKAGDEILQLFTDPKYREGLSAIHVTRNFPLVELFWGIEEYPDGIEGMFPPQREERFGTLNGAPAMQIKAILDGNVVHTIVHTAQFLEGDVERLKGPTERNQNDQDPQKRARENREKGLVASYFEGEDEAKVLAEMKAKREKHGIK